MSPRPASTSFGEAFSLTLITNDPVVAVKADEAGVDRIGLDFERLGKARRQAGVNGRLADHNWDELALIARSLVHADLFLRVNPLNADTRNEVERALQVGVRVLMLPFFSTAEEVNEFIRIVCGRARIVILLETAAAAVRIRDILMVQGVDEVMFGLNDLRLQFGVASHFEVLASPVIDALAAEVRRTGLPLAIGGVARHDDQSLPVPPQLIYAQLVRLGATGSWLSRSFFLHVHPNWDLRQAVEDLRKHLTDWSHASHERLQRARIELARRARRIAGDEALALSGRGDPSKSTTAR